jgi:hypothetical protein
VEGGRLHLGHGHVLQLRRRVQGPVKKLDLLTTWGPFFNLSLTLGVNIGPYGWTISPRDKAFWDKW